MMRHFPGKAMQLIKALEGGDWALRLLLNDVRNFLKIHVGLFSQIHNFAARVCPVPSVSSTKAQHCPNLHTLFLLSLESSRVLPL